MPSSNLTWGAPIEQQRLLLRNASPVRNTQKKTTVRRNGEREREPGRAEAVISARARGRNGGDPSRDHREWRPLDPDWWNDTERKRTFQRWYENDNDRDGGRDLEAARPRACHRLRDHFLRRPTTAAMQRPNTAIPYVYATLDPPRSRPSTFVSSQIPASSIVFESTVEKFVRTTQRRFAM